MLKIKLIFLVIYGAFLGIIGCCLAEEFNWTVFLVSLVVLVVAIITFLDVIKKV